METQTSRLVSGRGKKIKKVIQSREILSAVFSVISWSLLK